MKRFTNKLRNIRNRRMEEREKGFTLIELVIVVAIIGILMGVGIPTFNHFQSYAKVQALHANNDELRQNLLVHLELKRGAANLHTGGGEVFGGYMGDINNIWDEMLAERPADSKFIVGMIPQAWTDGNTYICIYSMYTDYSAGRTDGPEECKAPGPNFGLEQFE